MNVLREPPERDEYVLNHHFQMNEDNCEVPSTASSDISESLRAQILGITKFRRKPVPRTRASLPSPNPDSSYHTADSFVIVPSKERSSSFEIISVERKSGGDQNNPEMNDNSKNAAIPKKSKESNSTKSIYSMSIEQTGGGGENKRCITIQTQTIGIQTAPMENIGCGCMWRDCMCKSKRHADKKIIIPPETSVSTFGNFTDTSSQTFDIGESSHYCTCNCRRSKWADYDETQSSTEDHFSDNSEDSYATDFFDLPYQNNEEYLKLLRELEHKLIARNRERVRKTMMEFERRSRQNQNLEKPVWDYCDDNASLLQKLTRSQSRRGPVCYKCGRNKRADSVSDSVNSDILQNEKRWDEIKSIHTEMQPLQGMKGAKVERAMHKSHWQLDPRSGEWVKVSCFKQTDFARHPPHGDYLKEGHKSMPLPPTPNMFKKECHCRQKKRPK